MYGFVNLTERGTQSTSLSIQTVFNGINFDSALSDDEGSFTTLTVSGRANLTNRINTFEVPGMDGLMESNEHSTREREITVKYKISDNTNEGFRRRTTLLNGLLGGSKKELAFTDEDVVYYASLSVNELPEENSNSLIGTLKFLCSDPKKYGPENPIVFSGDSAVINTSGSAESQPVFELEVLAPITFAMIQNQFDEYMMIGRPTSVESTAKEEYTLLLSDAMNTLTGWASATTVTDGYIRGEIETDGASFRPKNFGTAVAPEKWQGPGLVKSLPEEVQDFEMDCIVQNDNIGWGTGMVEVYLLDTLDRQVARIHLSDSWPGSDRIDGRVQLGYDEYQRFPYITSAPGNIKNWNNFYGLMKLQRRGNRWWFYFAKIVDGKRVYVQQKHYIPPVDGIFKDKIAKIQVVFRIWPNTTATRMNIFNLKIWRINSLAEDEVPIIADVGDKITFDHINEETLINGEDAKRHKDFGASYFTLKKGENQMILYPSGTFNASGKYRDSYK
ncbi:MAG: distal tail protein Dit [Bacillota bacterium]